MNNISTTCRKMLMTLALGLFTVFAFAQQNVAGVVVDQSGEPLIGVSILVKGTTNGTITDFDGNFALTGLKETDVLEISYMGYATQTITVGKQANIKVTLSEDTQQIDEVVVVGYGQMKKTDLTGSVSSADGGALAAKGTTSALEALQGSVPGVNVTQASGRSGDFDIQIRGKSSINGDSSPLFVVDGVICTDISFLNPQDIERMDILKDASSTAIYGSRATAGVVVITTKSGTTIKDKKQDAKMTVSYDGYYGYSQIARMPDFMDAQEFLNYRFMNFLSSPNFNGSKMVTSQPIWKMDAENYRQSMIFNGDGESVMKNFIRDGKTYDWPSMVTRNGHKTNHYLSFSGASEKINYHFGFGYNLDQGVYIKDRQDRFNIKGSVDAKINKYLSAGFNINLAYTKNSYTDDAAVGIAFRQNAFAQPKDADGNYWLMPAQVEALGTQSTSYNFTSAYNPLEIIDKNSKESKTYRALGNLYLQVKPADWVSFKTTFSPNFVNKRTGEYKYYTEKAQEESGSHEEYTSFEWTWDNQLDFNKTWGDHTLGAMLLFSMNQYKYDYSQIGRTTTTGDDAIAMMTGTQWHNLYAGAIDDKNTGTSYKETSMMSVAARVNYNYKGKYMITGTVRTDGSSKFTKGHQWGWFPSAAIAWRMSEEDWLKDVNEVSNIKLRLSYGITGNNSVAKAYNMVGVSGPSIYAFGTALANGFYPSGVVNSALSWEKSHEWNAGFDFGFFHDRISGTFDFYNKVSNDLLYARSLPLVSGGGTILDNVGSVLNRGVELSLTTVNVDMKGWRWTTSFNFAYNKNQVLSINGEQDNIINSSDPIKKSLFVGEAVNNIYTYNWQGIVSDQMMTVPDNAAAKNAGFTPGAEVRECDYYYKVYGWQEGMPKVEDRNGDGTITDDDKLVLGSQDPKWTANISSTLSWKGIDFSFSLYTKQDFAAYNAFIADATDYHYRGYNKLDVDYYIPAGTLIGCDGVNADGTYINPVYQETTHYGSFPMPNAVSSQEFGMGQVYYSNTKYCLSGVKQHLYYWKVKNITLGYNLPKKALEPWKCQSMRIYFNVMNPFCWSNGYMGFDPEWANAKASNDGPSTITYQFGLSLKF